MVALPGVVVPQACDKSLVSEINYENILFIEEGISEIFDSDDSDYFELELEDGDVVVRNMSRKPDEVENKGAYLKACRRG